MTNENGQYTLTGVPAGTYSQVIANAYGKGFDPGVATGVTVAASATTTRNFTLARNWAALDSGASVLTGTGEVGCSRDNLIDTAFNTQWSTSSPARADQPGEKSVTVVLPSAVDVSSFAIEPTGGCRAGSNASLGQYRVEVSTNGTTFTTAASGTFTSAHLGKRNIVLPNAGTGSNVRFVRLVGVSTQNQSPGSSGATYMEVTELQVYGTPRAGARVTGGVLRYEGTPGTNTVTIAPSGANYTVQDTAATLVPGVNCSTVNANTLSCAGASLFAADAGAGNDSITNNTALASTLRGAEGADTLQGGTAADTVEGGSGADTLRGMNGNDSLRASDGAPDTQLDCDGGTTPGASDQLEADVDDPAATGCESSARGYPRPIGATPLRASLVPAFRFCGQPNAVHGPPLEHDSCRPPLQESAHLTVGTPETNGMAVNSSGFVKFTVQVGNPGTPADEADVQVVVSITDVWKTTAPLSDYMGQLRVVTGIGITDKFNGPAQNAAGTTDTALRFPVGCTPTASTSIGSTCATTTTLDAVIPGSIVEGKRSIWEMGQVYVYDGGRDGVASTTDNMPFMTQGVFVPSPARRTRACGR